MSDTDWYLLDPQGRRYGPYDRRLVEELRGRGELADDTPVWHPGLARWQPAARVLGPMREHGGGRAHAEEIARLRQTLQKSAPVAPSPRRGTPRAPSPASPPPSRSAPAASRTGPRAPSAPGTAAAAGDAALARDRVLAGLTDLLIVAVLLSLPPLAGTAWYWDPGPGSGRFLWLLLWALGDAALLASLGTTPGRAIYGLRVTGADGARLTQQRALVRSALLLLTVLGLGHPFFAVVLGFVAWRMLVSRGQGWWDLATGSSVTRDPVPPWRRAAGPLLLVALALALLGLRRAARVLELPGGFV